MTINWFLNLKAKYGEQYPRHTQIAAFDQIVAQKVTEQNQKLYVNREEGFIGTALKKDELVSACSDLDDVILFYRDGTYKVTRVPDKLFVGETERSKAEGKKAEIMHVAVFKKNDKRTIYNVIYRDGKRGAYLMKRFFVSGITRDREYDVTQGTPGSRVVYFTSNPNGEAEVVHITLKADNKIKKLTFDIDFADLAIKGRITKGNTVTKNTIHRINLKSHGVSTLGGRKVWFDNAVRRLNYDERGHLLGEFGGTDRVLVILKTGEYYATDTDINNHYEDNIAYIGKYRSGVVWTAIYSSPDTDGRPYVKRFQLEPSVRRQNFINDEGDGQMLLLSRAAHPHVKVIFGGSSTFREPIEVDLEEFIAVKGVKARGKRLTNYEVAEIEEEINENEIENEIEDENTPPSQDDTSLSEEPTYNSSEEPPSEEEQTEPVDKTEDELRDEMNGQLRLF
ncbi:MAG: hypothetical protein J5593_00145 [Bacteroidaceae bacterium]|nr:hypothetical protein [Bacteroidaceae bacterium]